MKRPARSIGWFAVVAAVAVSLLLSGSGSAFAATSASGTVLSAAEAKDPDELRERLARVVDAYKENEDELGLLARRTKKVARQVAATKNRFSRARAQVAEIARTTYVNGGMDDSTAALLSKDGPGKVARRMATMSILSVGDDIALRDAERERKRLGEQLADLRKVKKRAAAEQAKLNAKRSELKAALREAARLAAQRAERASRPSGQFTCPIGSPYNMMNTFGAPRGGGRSHEGVDIAAPKSTPIYAVEDGTITRAYSNTLGGIALILEGESGDSYYYAHQEVNLVQTGQRVEAGELVARVGMTGDAQGTIYHLHFERWPNGGSAVDPWPFLLPLCGRSG